MSDLRRRAVAAARDDAAYGAGAGSPGTACNARAIAAAAAHDAAGAEDSAAAAPTDAAAAARHNAA